MSNPTSNPSSNSDTSASAVPQTLRGKVAIVSGSSSGIGLAIARELSARGARVAVNYPHASLAAEGEAAAASLPTKSVAVCADIGSAEGPGRLVAAALDALCDDKKTIDIVVNNAALAVNLPLEEQTLAHWDQLVNLNGRGTFLLTQAVLPHLPRPNSSSGSGSGRIVNICSVSARGPPPGQTIYAGTKGMVDAFTRCWARELPPRYGCTVNAVSPGPTATAGFKAAGPEAMKMLQPTIDATPAGRRMGEPEEIAYAVAFLCEERAGWVNGEHMLVNGGLYID
ncbi:hypothetical protein GGR56DRAFT_692352 [Xylariaceae sp. FL0804]|nr:hypothetical protein GGR56DRAFT_692352 [Xylariaceae sp. FL0804]